MLIHNKHTSIYNSVALVLVTGMNEENSKLNSVLYTLHLTKKKKLKVDQVSYYKKKKSQVKMN